MKATHTQNTALRPDFTPLEQHILDMLAIGPSSRARLRETYGHPVSFNTINSTVTELCSLGLVRQYSSNDRQHRGHMVKLAEAATTLPALEAAILLDAKRNKGTRSGQFAAKHGISKAKVEAAMRALCRMGEAVSCAVKTATSSETELRASGYLPSNMAFVITHSED